MEKRAQAHELVLVETDATKNTVGGHYQQSTLHTFSAEHTNR